MKTWMEKKELDGSVKGNREPVMVKVVSSFLKSLSLEYLWRRIAFRCSLKQAELHNFIDVASNPGFL